MIARRAITGMAQYLALTVFAIFLAFPFIWLISTSFKSSRELNSLSVDLIPKHLTLANFGVALEAQGIVRSAVNSISVAVATTLVAVSIAVPGAYAMARYRSKLRNIGVGWILISQIVPVPLIIIPMFFLLKSMGLINSLIGLLLVYVVFTLPFTLWILQGYVKSIPRDIEEAASVDGAGRLRILWYVVLPLLRPAIVATAIFTFVAAYNEFFFALVLLQSPQNYTLPVTLSTFVNGQGTTLVGPLAAGALLASIPSIVFFVFLRRGLSGTLLAGAVRG